jgi:hypothetical protein
LARLWNKEALDQSHDISVYIHKAKAFLRTTINQSPFERDRVVNTIVENKQKLKMQSEDENKSYKFNQKMKKKSLKT